MAVRPFLNYMLKAVLWGALTYLLAVHFARHALWFFAAAILIFSIPIATAALYTSAVSQMRNLEAFATRGRVFRLLSGRVIRVAFWSVWAVVFAFWTLLQFHTYTFVEWSAFFLVVPVFYGLYHFLRHRVVGPELKPHLATGISLRYTMLLCPIVMTILYMGLVKWVGQPIAYVSLESAIQAQREAVADMTGSATVAELAHWLAWYNGFRAYALGSFSTLSEAAPWLVLLLGNIVVFFNASAMLGCFVIPREELRRVLGPLSLDTPPAPLKPSRVALVSAILTVVIGFIYLPTLATLEQTTAHDQRLKALREKSDAVLTVAVEFIDGIPVSPGTIEQVETLSLELMGQLKGSRMVLAGEADLAFDSMKGNVDEFLDWYYSLSAEYMRVGKLLIGDLEPYMQEKLAEYLRRGEAFVRFEQILNVTLAEHEEARAAYETTARNVVNKNRMMPGEKTFAVLKSVPLESLLVGHQDTYVVTHRVGLATTAGGLAGGITGIITAKIVGNAAAKATLKLAAKALAKGAASKSVGGFGGAAVGGASGALVGSVVPGLGTTVGGVVGVISGLVVGVSVDKMFLVLEEGISRELFRSELITSIETVRAEFRMALLGEDH